MRLSHIGQFIQENETQNHVQIAFSVGILETLEQTLFQAIHLTSRMLRYLHWWMKKHTLMKSHPLVHINWITITRVASAAGWGAHGNQITGQGRWSFRRPGMKHPGNPGRLPCVTIPKIRDYGEARTASNRQKGCGILHPLTRGAHKSLLRDVEPISLRVERNLRDLRAVYLPARLNSRADRLSRRSMEANEQSLSVGL